VDSGSNATLHFLSRFSNGYEVNFDKLSDYCTLLQGAPYLRAASSSVQSAVVPLREFVLVCIERGHQHT